MLVLNGTANVLDGSHVFGEFEGIRMWQAHTVTPETMSLHVSNSTVEGRTGAAVMIERREGYPDIPVDVLISNGARLIGGNGNIIQANELSIASIKVDNAQLEGNVAAAESADIDVTIQNHGSIKGTFIGIDALTLNSSGTWKLIGDDTMGHIAMGGGIVELSDGTGAAYNTLTLNTLAGNGTFVMGTNLGATDGDRLIVADAGGATGDHMVHVRNTGIEPSASHEYMLVDTNGGDAVFALRGGLADVGTYKYGLEQRGDDWFLVGTSQTTPGTDTAVGLHGIGPTVFYGELATLRQRMGDLRLNGGQDGTWTRAYGRGFSIKSGAGQVYDQTQWGVSVGADREVTLGGETLLVGGLAGFSRSTIKLDGGSTGDVNSYYGGLYATWMHDSGFYVDGLAKLNSFRDKTHVVMSDGSGAEGSYNAMGFGGQIEIGKHIKMGEHTYIEPFAQLASVTIGGSDYHLDNGMDVANGSMNSLLGRIGVTVGLNHALESGGVLQPYLRLAVAQEFASGGTLRVNETVFSNDLKGFRGEIGAGLAAQIAPNLQITGDFEYASGKHVDQDWGVNFGLRYNF
ncbi:autotransporter outer membrane beta-barrel domain-containing protein [Mesorhizobium sp. NBSH29]|uniref:autotransporter outer membrane beta-barrel domain-containing protein n=1 Tax=Mesorhizobium sp. NBSH29 TaxID=2654249 RepID=UPI0018964969|nr:autotransporter outer membrane beta-barrel domain-containing protein [Mesorhizobium sp. NBSH29]